MQICGGIRKHEMLSFWNAGFLQASDCCIGLPAFHESWLHAKELAEIQAWKAWEVGDGGGGSFLDDEHLFLFPSPVTNVKCGTMSDIGDRIKHRRTCGILPLKSFG